MKRPDRISRLSSMAVAEANVRREARKTRRALWVETAIKAMWPVWAVLALVLGLMLLGVPSLLPREWHYAFLAAGAAAFVALFIRGILTLHRPTEAEALARLDMDQRGRPAQTLKDDQATGSGDKGSEALWAAHQRQLADKASKLKAKAPDLRVSNEDRFALRHAGAIVLAAGAIGYFAADATRLADQLTPGEAAASGPPVVTASLEAWASPPLYTGVAPVYLTRIDPSEGPLTLPEGTQVSLRVFDSEIAPTLTQTVDDEAASFTDQGAQVFDATFEIDAEGAISVKLGDEEMAAWDFAVIPDESPTIDFHEELQTGARGAMVLEYRARDDYGVRYAGAEITLDAAAEPPVGGEVNQSLYEPIILDLPLPLTGDSRAIAEIMIEDLTEHPWAGLPVVIKIHAEDAAGQRGEAEERTLLPGRTFYHPMAKALIEQRRSLAFSLATAPRVHDVLEAVMLYPEDIFDDNTAYLTARMAVRRLGYALEDGRVEPEAKSIIDLLWKAAIRLEDGNLASAAERLARAQERLRQAIENGATDEEISQLMQELREAMREYLAEMAREAMRDQAQNGQQQQQQQGQQGEQQMMTQQDLEEMLNQLEEAIKNGQMDLARQMMQALQQMMENLQMAQPGQGQPGQGEQMMNQMGDMIGEQQGLADRSFDQLRDGQQGQEPGEQQGGGNERGQEGEQQGNRGNADDPGQIARDQQALRELLDQLRDQVPGGGSEETRRALEEADRAMGDAVDQLEQGDARGAVDDQVRALDALREGRQSLGRDLAEAQGRQDGQQAGRDGRGADARDEDPLGRPRASDGPIDGDATRVPGASLGKRARELQEEIRRRAGERERPEPELDYLERLLDRF